MEPPGADGGERVPERMQADRRAHATPGRRRVTAISRRRQPGKARNRSPHRRLQAPGDWKGFRTRPEPRPPGGTGDGAPSPAGDLRRGVR